MVKSSMNESFQSVLQRKKNNVDRALANFDDFYGSVYGVRWRKMRAALLTEHKYISMVNNFGDTEEISRHLELNGAINIKWLILWAFLVSDSPSKHHLISQEERDMIVTQLNSESAPHSKDNKRPAVPWRSVLKSVPFWAILVAHCCSNWGWYMFLIEIPFYLKQVLKFNVASNAVRSALSFFPMLVFSIILGKTLDILRSKQKITTTFARKFATACCTIIPAACLLGLCYIGCQHTLAVIIMSIGIVFMGAMFSGFLSNHIDIAPNFAGTLVALTNTVATIPGIVVPLFVGRITEGNQTIDAWRTIFFVTIALFVIEFLVFTCFGSGKVQSWNNTEQTADQNEIKPLTPKEKGTGTP